MKIAAVVITYHPELNLLHNNIKAFIDYVDKVFVWRNSNEQLPCNEEFGSKIEFLGSGNNKFLALPLNQTIKLCLEQGFDYILTMDQDSMWTDFKGFLNAAMKCDDKEDIAIFAPNVNKYLKEPSIEYRDIEWVIQSGMLINLKIIEKLGVFREDYGIYGIDEEFCYWVRINGYKTRIFTNYHLIQKYGNATKTKFGFTVYNYSPFARYHIIRNMIWMKREFNGSTTTRRILHVIFDNYRDILLVEKNKLVKAAAFTRGIYHGLFDRIKQKRKVLNGYKIN